MRAGRAGPTRSSARRRARTRSPMTLAVRPGRRRSRSRSRVSTCAPSRCRSRSSCCCSSCCRSAPEPWSPRSRPAGWPSRCADVADRAARLGAGDFRSFRDRHGIPSSTASPTCSTPPRRRSRSWCSGSASWSATSRTSCAAGSPRCSCGSTSSRPTPTRTPAEEALAALEQTERLSGVLDELLEAARAARAAGARAAGPRGRAHGRRRASGGPALRAAGRTLKVRVPDGLLAGCTPGAGIREAVGALVDNALSHGAGTVTLSARAAENSLVIEVSDAGPGVPEELVPHVFDRGVSVGSSTGLGLGAGPCARRGRRRPAGAVAGAAAGVHDLPAGGPRRRRGRRPRARRRARAEHGPGSGGLSRSGPGGARPRRGRRSGGRPTSGTPSRRAHR